MKINDVIVAEGVADWAKKIGQGVQGAVRGVQAGRAQRASTERTQKVVKDMFKLWNEELANHPNLNATQISKLLVNWTNQQLNDKPGTKVPAPVLSTENDTKNTYSYLTQRTQEYFQKAADPGVTRQRSQIQTGYALPRSDADIDIQGHIYAFDIGTNKWFDENSGQEITNPTDIQVLNKKYYDLKIAAQGGQIKDPDVPYREPELPLEESNRHAIKESRMRLKEGGNAIQRSTPVKREDVAGVVDQAKKALPAELLRNIQTDIGSAGYKVESGDIDIMVEAEDVVAVFKTHESKDPVKDSKKKLEAYFKSKGIEAVTNGRNVSIGIEYTEQSTNQKRLAQVDVMVIHEAAIVAPWHQHGLRGMYNDPDFKGSELFMLISSIAKHLNLKFDAFGAKLIHRDTGDVVGRTRKQVAKILLGPKAKETDLNSVQSALKALESDPDREGKLVQARQDAAKGLIRLPETAPHGTAQWFRQMSEVVK